jgi:hypothetical protein
MEVLPNIPVEFDLGEMLRRFRVPPGGPDAADVEQLVARVRDVVKAKAIYDVCYVEKRGRDRVELAHVVFTSRVLAVNLDGVHRVFPFIATCGGELDDIAGMTGDSLRQYWLDELRVMALRAASARVRERIEERYRPGKLSSMSPGSLGDWPITQQTQLFSVFGDVEAEIGVRLTDSFLMLPMKSISGIYFPTERSFASCQLCPRDDCPGRSAPYDPSLWKERYAEGSEGS